MHSQNICHRDLNPKNILCNKKGTKVKIIDFGCVGNFNKQRKPTMSTKTGSLLY